MCAPPVETQVIRIVSPGHCCRFTFPFSFFLASFFLSPLSFSAFLFLFRFVFSSCRFPVCFLYRFLRFSFLFPAFLAVGFRYSVDIASLCSAPPALLASQKYAYSPCVLSSFLRSSCLLILRSIHLFLFSSLQFSFRFGHCFIQFLSCGRYAVSSVSVSAPTCVVHDIYLDTSYVRTHARTLISPCYFSGG